MDYYQWWYRPSFFCFEHPKVKRLAPRPQPWYNYSIPGNEQLRQQTKMSEINGRGFESPGILEVNSWRK
jgi:hypothetical protein